MSEQLQPERKASHITPWVKVLHQTAAIAAVRGFMAGYEVGLSYDEQSGFLTKKNFQKRVESFTKEARRESDPAKVHSLLHCDLDGFKKINTRLGMENADILLDIVFPVIAPALEETRVRGEFTGRYGGDEFVRFFPDTPLDIAVVKATEMIERINQIHVDASISPLGRLGITVAVAELPQGGDYRATHKQLDALVTFGKQNGMKNQVFTHVPEGLTAVTFLDPDNPN